MKKFILIVALILVLTPPLLAQYVYYSSDTFSSINTTKWYQNGTLTPSGVGLMSSSSSGGSLISKETVPGDPNQYEVRTVVSYALCYSCGIFVQYLSASPDALTGPSATGSFYSVELQNPGLYGTATLSLYKCESGVITLLTSTQVPARSGMVIRSVLRTDQIAVYVDDFFYLWTSRAGHQVPAGKPGVGVHSTVAGGPMYSSISSADLGACDTIGPNQVELASIGTSLFANRADFQWQGVMDNVNGIGLAYYQILRSDGVNDVWMANTPDSEYEDATVSPSTTYTYTIRAVDYHLSQSAPTIITITTPPAGSVDPRRVGVRPTGSYWGAGGEKIDLLSRNLNLTIPLFTALGRGGWGVPFALSYNSQQWRQDPGGTWKLGRDVGYGFGWRLMAGSLTPYWTSHYTLHHYLFIDSSGAEYRLDVNTNGVWTSREGIYLSYDSVSKRLYFPDGSFWVFNCEAAGTEQDAGTRYPTLMQDSNGNQILIRYLAGQNLTEINTSARINEVEDVRAVNGGSTYRTYSFTYAQPPNSFPHLASIANHIGTTETYLLSYGDPQVLADPYGTNTWGATCFLLTLKIGTLPDLVQHSLEYFPVGGSLTGELTRLNLPTGGYLKWDYQSFTFTGQRNLREVTQARVSPGSSEWIYSINNESGDEGRTLHAAAKVNYPDNAGQKVWWFHVDVPESWKLGLNSGYEQRSEPDVTPALSRQDYNWTQDNGNLYINSVLTTLANTPSPLQSKVEQTRDADGNITQVRQYDYGSLVNPARVYDYTYLGGSNYLSRYIRNRLLTATVKAGLSGQPIALVTNQYDAQTLTSLSGLREHDSANYGAGFNIRGNATRTERPGAVTNLRYDITGNVVSADDNNNHTVSITGDSTRNYAVPSVITPYSETNLNTSFTYAISLAPTSETQPNTSISRTEYDSYGRPLRSYSPH